MRELVEAFFRERSIVNHHIASFNDFLPTIDNPNSRMQRIVDSMRSSPEDDRRGIFKLDEDRTEGDVIEIRIGRRRDDRGRADLDAKPTISVGTPIVKEANGATHALTPMEARLRNLNYTAPIYLDFTVVENGIEREPERVHVGNLPVMVKSKKCSLHKENLEIEGELTESEYRQKLIEMGEDPFDSGGYFIIGGTERALISLEDLAPNRVLVEYNERYGRRVPVAKVFSQREGYRALTLVEMKKDGMLIVTVPTASGQIPLIILMKALGMEKDEEIYNAIVSVQEMANIVYANIEECQNKKLYPPNGIFTRDDALNYLERRSARRKEIKISSAIRPDLLSQRLLHALATGNWVGGRAGVSQLLDRTSNMSALSHLRRVTSPLTRSQPHFEARDLHPTQWGRLCPNETPEGQNCGLVKNLALVIDVSEGFPEEEGKLLLAKTRRGAEDGPPPVFRPGPERRRRVDRCRRGRRHLHRAVSVRCPQSLQGVQTPVESERRHLGEHGESGRRRGARVRALPQDVRGEVRDYEGTHPHRGRPGGHPRRRLRRGPVPGAQLVPARHDGRGDGEAVLGPRREQLSPEAGHAEPPPPLSGTAARPDGFDEVRLVQRAPRGPEFRRGGHVPPRVQHGRRDRDEQGLDRPGPRPLVVHADVPRGRAAVSGWPGRPLRDPVARCARGPGGPVVRQSHAG